MAEKTKMENDLVTMAKNTLTEKVRTDFYELDGVFLPEEYKLFPDAVENFEFFDDDVLVCSFQKSGTSWVQEMVWCIANKLDFEAAKLQINERFPFLEFSGTIAMARIAVGNPELPLPEWIKNSVEFCKKVPKPRFFKCHHPFNLLPKQIRTGEKTPKIIYVARNPKDVCVSFYHHSRLLEGYSGSFDDFCELFLGNKVIYAPYWNHVGGFWQRRNQNNILFIKYEDMKKDLPSVIIQTATFLGKALNAKEISTLSEHLSFAKMKTNPALNKERSIETIKKNKLFGDHNVEGEFIRSGTVGQWKTTMNADMIDKFDRWFEKNIRSCQGLTF